MTAHRKLILVTWHMISQQYYQQPLWPLVQSKSLFVMDQHAKETQVKSTRQECMNMDTVPNTSKAHAIAVWLIKINMLFSQSNMAWRHLLASSAVPWASWSRSGSRSWPGWRSGPPRWWWRTQSQSTWTGWSACQWTPWRRRWCRRAGTFGWGLSQWTPGRGNGRYKEVLGLVLSAIELDLKAIVNYCSRLLNMCQQSYLGFHEKMKSLNKYNVCHTPQRSFSSRQSPTWSLPEVSGRWRGLHHQVRG